MARAGGPARFNQMGEIRLAPGTKAEAKMIKQLQAKDPAKARGAVRLPDNLQSPAQREVVLKGLAESKLGRGKPLNAKPVSTGKPKTPKSTKK